MTGWIIYEEADALKNQEYIKMFTAAAANYHIELQLLYIHTASETPYFSLYLQQETASVPLQITEGFSNLPDFVINRSRNAMCARLLEAKNVRVFNPAIVTEVCNHKQKTYEFLAQYHVPIMKTIYDVQLLYTHARSTDAQQHSHLLNENMHYPLVIKPSCGHGGHLVKLVHDQTELQKSIEAIESAYTEHPGYVLQQCASEIGKDLRVYVLGGKVIASVMRSAFDNASVDLNSPNIDIRSNYSLGHHARLHTLTDEENALVQRIIPLLPFDCIGIDFVYEKGHPIFNEIEDAVGARMLYANSDTDLVKEYMYYIMQCMGS